MTHSKQIEILKPTRFSGEEVQVGTVMTVSTAMAVDLVARERARVVEPAAAADAAVPESEVVVEQETDPASTDKADPGDPAAP